MFNIPKHLKTWNIPILNIQINLIKTKTKDYICPDCEYKQQIKSEYNSGYIFGYKKAGSDSYNEFNNVMENTNA
jgi:hypothetical protein